MLQVLVAISHKFCCRKEACGYAKVIRKKEKKGQVSKNRKRGTKATRLKKKERRKE
jgi:hypothetical protein